MISYRGKGSRPRWSEVGIFLFCLKRKIEVLAPPIIMLLGSQSLRSFFPDFRGKASDAAGKVIYSKEYDANFVIGFSPGEIYHDPGKQTNLNNVFAAAADMIA